MRVRGSAYLTGKAFDVSASVDPSEQLAITTSPGATFSLDELLLRASATSGLTGTIRYTSGPLTVRGRIMSAKHGPLESTQSAVQGRWIGNSLVRGCTFSGWTECPNLSRLFRLSLSQSGGTIAGDLDLNADERFRVPVSGSFTPSFLTLGGASTRPQAGGTYQLRVTSWTSRTDAFGRMDGAFTLEEESVAPDHRNIARYESELQNVYLLPDWLQLGAASAQRVARLPIPQIWPAASVLTP